MLIKTRCCTACSLASIDMSADNKVNHTPLSECRRVLISIPLPGLEPVGGEILSVMHGHGHGYTRPSQPQGWYQIILLGDRGTYVLTTCPGLHTLFHPLTVTLPRNLPALVSTRAGRYCGSIAWNMEG